MFLIPSLIMNEGIEPMNGMFLSFYREDDTLIRKVRFYWWKF